jgi:hypothetical protein
MESSDTPKEGDWVSNPTPPFRGPPRLDLLLLRATPGQAEVIEFKRSAPRGRIQASTNQVITIVTGNLLPVRILVQERPGAHFKIAKELKTPNKKTPTF